MSRHLGVAFCGPLWPMNSGRWLIHTFLPIFLNETAPRQVYGPESSGKTTLALHAIAEVQRQGGTAALIDAEHAFDPEYSRVPPAGACPESRRSLFRSLLPLYVMLQQPVGLRACGGQARCKGMAF